MIKIFEEYINSSRLMDIEKDINMYKTYLKNKERFKVGEYALMIPFNNQRVKIVEVTDHNTIWIENGEGYRAEFLIKDFVSELEFHAKKYNL